MDAIFLLPGLVSLFLVIRGKVEAAFLWVYLPMLLLLPHRYAAHIPHAPSISAAQAALIPIGFVALYRLILRGWPAILDILVFLFLIGISLSEVLREYVVKDGILYVADSFISIFLAYLVGRTLIEPGLRIVTVRRIVILMLLVAPIGLLEWRLGQNVFGIIAQRYFPNVDLLPSVQIRSGHGRFSASFSDAEISGIALGMILALNSWLVFVSKKRPELGLGKVQRWLERFHVPGIMLLLFLLATQSRGPLLAFGAAWLVLQLRKFKHRKLAFVIVAVVMIVGGYIGYRRFLSYTNIATNAEIADEMQGSAVYRRQMNERYQPLAEKGGMLGWGYLSHPKLPGLWSIDNEYLLVRLSFGTLGLTLLLLICAETIRHIAVLLWKMRDEVDRVFVVSMLGAMAVFWLTIYTVYVGEQLPQFAFLLIGWSRSIQPQLAASESEAPAPARPKFSFRRVYQ